jgi:hypothetical protein
VERPPKIESERLDLVALLPEEIEALIAGDTIRANLETSYRPGERKR